MAMIKCSKCGNDISSNAETCPRCNEGTVNVNKKPCRRCGTMLRVDVYRYVTTSHSIVEGNSNYRQHVCYIKCPNCGEPKPIMSVTDYIIVKIIFLVLPFLLAWIVAKGQGIDVYIIAFFVIAIPEVFMVALLSRRYKQKMSEYEFVGLVILGVITYFVLKGLLN